jgi:hypothetical protein
MQYQRNIFIYEYPNKDIIFDFEKKKKLQKLLTRFLQLLYVYSRIIIDVIYRKYYHIYGNNAIKLLSIRFIAIRRLSN